MEWFTQILLSIFLLAVGPYMFQKFKLLRKYKNLIDRFPGPTPSLIFRSVSEYMVSRESLAAVFDRRFKQYGGLIRVWNITYLSADLFLASPKHFEVVLTSSEHITKSHAYKRFHSWLGTGLLTSTGRKWLLHRKLITPAFHFKILEDFFEVFVTKSNAFVRNLRKLPEDNVVDLLPLISKCTLDIICETAMGTNINIQEDEEHKQYVKNICEISELITYREFRPWLYPEFVFYNTSEGKRYLKCISVIHGFTKKVIRERKLQRKNSAQKASEKENKAQNIRDGSKRKLALLDLLLETQESGQPITDESIQEEVHTFMFEGHDTTAMALSWALYLLGRHPEIQKGVAEELDQIFKHSQRNPTLDDLSDMKYLERVIKESQRLYPSVPFIGRYIKEDTSLGDDYVIPANTNIIIDIYHTHRNPDHFPNPDLFNPDNFLPEKIRQRHPYAYIPFSAGPRNCIGQKFAIMEEKTVLSSILRNFRVEAIEDNISILQELTTKPANGLRVKLFPRSSS